MVSVRVWVLGVLGGGVGMGIRSTWWWCRYGY